MEIPSRRRRPKNETRDFGAASVQDHVRARRRTDLRLHSNLHEERPDDHAAADAEKSRGDAREERDFRELRQRLVVPHEVGGQRLVVGTRRAPLRLRAQDSRCVVPTSGRVAASTSGASASAVETTGTPP